MPLGTEVTPTLPQDVPDSSEGSGKLSSCILIHMLKAFSSPTNTCTLHYRAFL